VAVLNVDMFFVNGKAMPGSFFYSAFQGICVGLGYALAMLLMSGIRERWTFAMSPRQWKDFPLAFIIASIMSLAFMGLMDLNFKINLYLNFIFK